MTESERGTSKLFKTSKIIQIGLEYQKLEENEDRICFGFSATLRVENMKKSVHGMYLNKLKIINFAVEFDKILQKSIL